MRNPAPIILSTLLGASALILVLRQPDPKPVDPAPPAAEPAPSATPVETPDEAPETVEPDTPDAEAKTPVWPQDSSDIPADPQARFGRLPNGFRYLIYPNAEPPKRVSLRLHIATGSLMEADDQQGLAHFLEHMVFNGSKNFTPDELIPRMQRLGIAFGAHANAYTSFDETVYMLDLPDLSDETLKLGFTVMRDFGDGAKLDPEEIDKERGVILSEKTSRDSVSFRLMQQQFSELLPDSLLAKRFPIGTEEVIRTAPRERFVDYYTRYYTPDRMTFIVVGDVDLDAMESRIRSTFESLANPAEPGKNPDLGAIQTVKGIKPAIFSDREVPSTDLALISIRPFQQTPDTSARRLSILPLSIAHAVIGRRFERLSKLEGSPVTSGSASRTELFNYAELGSFEVSVADDRWQEALPVMEQEFRRALEHGFTEAELAEAKANLLSAYEQAVKAAPTRTSPGLATGLARSVNDGSVFSTPEKDLEILQQGLDSFTPESCHQAFRQFWADQGLHLVLTTRDEPEDGEAALLAIYEQSRTSPVAAPEQRQVAGFGYTGFGTPGSVASRKEIEDLGFSQLVLSNGVRVNLKKTDFEKNSIRLLARFGSGKLTQPAKSPGLDMFARSIFEAGGLGKHSVDDLQQILAGRNVSTSFGISDDAFTLGGRTTPKDLELQLQLMCAQLTDPGYRQEALVQFQNQIPALYQQLKFGPASAEAEKTSWLYGGDFRWTIPEEAKLRSYTIDDVKKWLTPALTGEYLELSIVGDYEEEALLAALSQTFGAIPPRASKKPELPAARKVNFPKGPATRVFTYESKVPQGIATVIWRTEGLRGNQPLFRRLNVLGAILNDRLREEIREKLGASYSPNAQPGGSDALENFGYMSAVCIGKPEDTTLLADTAARIGNEMASKDGVSEDELQRAITPLLKQLEQTKRDNTYWLGTVLAQSQEDPKRVDLIRSRDDDYKSITATELNRLAVTYLSNNKVLKAIVKPKE